tara:strand:- start:2074 stop:2463 length:390 start_codon:yes stop_codon:yes gene_type:complete
MKKKDLEYTVKVEKAIAKKYGIETIANPKAFWDDEKEKEYLKELKILYEKEYKKKKVSEKIEKDGFLLPKNLITKAKENKRKCPVCDIYSFDIKDDLYMNKFECCFKCYIQYVEQREERWNKGWRPKKE